MEDLEAAPGSPVKDNHNEPEGNNDPGDTLNPEHEQENRYNAGAHDDDDDESELEELSEKEFEDFDPAALNIPDKPVQVDESNVGLLGVHKRKRTDEEERERKKKKKEKKRDKQKRSKKTRRGDGDDDFGRRGEHRRQARWTK